MAFLFGCLVVISISVIAFQKTGVKYPFSIGMFMGIALSILGTISLAQNYTQSLIPEANDGMGISNEMAYWIIGEDSWSQEMFKTIFEQSILLSIILIAAFPIVLVLEYKFSRKA